MSTSYSLGSLISIKGKILAVPSMPAFTNHFFLCFGAFSKFISWPTLPDCCVPKVFKEKKIQALTSAFKRLQRLLSVISGEDKACWQLPSKQDTWQRQIDTNPGLTQA